MSLRRQFAALACIAVLIAPASAVLAQSAPVTVKVNMARILRINSPAATVIVGNPGIADVTIQDPQTLVLTGRSYGQTNLIVLDTLGNPVADTVVQVVQDQADMVTVYLGDARNSYACTPVCQPTVMLGDEGGFTKQAATSAEELAKLATPK